MAKPKGNCHDMDPEIFFPVSSLYTGSIQASKAACQGGIVNLGFQERMVPKCPLLESCLEWALDNREDSGTWGGKTEWERRTMLGTPGHLRKRHHIVRGTENGARTGLMAELAST